jgi:hypothetical protein
MELRIIVNLCDHETPDAVVQLRAHQVALIANALLKHQPERDDLEDHLELTTAFSSLRSMWAAGEEANQ